MQPLVTFNALQGGSEGPGHERDQFPIEFDSAGGGVDQDIAGGDGCGIDGGGHYLVHTSPTAHTGGCAFTFFCPGVGNPDNGPVDDVRRDSWVLPGTNRRDNAWTWTNDSRPVSTGPSSRIGTHDNGNGDASGGGYRTRGQPPDFVFGRAGSRVLAGTAVYFFDVFSSTKVRWWMAWLFGQPLHEPVRSGHLLQDGLFANVTRHGDAWRLYGQAGSTSRVFGVPYPPSSTSGLPFSSGRRLAVPFRLFWFAIGSSCIYEIAEAGVCAAQTAWDTVSSVHRRRSHIGTDAVGGSTARPESGGAAACSGVYCAQDQVGSGAAAIGRRVPWRDRGPAPRSDVLSPTRQEATGLKEFLSQIALGVQAVVSARVVSCSGDNGFDATHGESSRSEFSRIGARSEAGAYLFQRGVGRPLLESIHGGDREPDLVGRAPRTTNQVPDVSDGARGDDRYGRQPLGLRRVSGLHGHWGVLGSTREGFLSERQGAPRSGAHAADVREVAARQERVGPNGLGSGMLLSEPTGRSFRDAIARRGAGIALGLHGTHCDTMHTFTGSPQHPGGCQKSMGGDSVGVSAGSSRSVWSALGSADTYADSGSVRVQAQSPVPQIFFDATGTGDARRQWTVADVESARGALRVSPDTATDAGTAARAQRGDPDDTGDAVVRRRVVSFGVSNGDTTASDVTGGRDILGARWNFPDITPIPHIGVDNSGASAAGATSVSAAACTVAADADTEWIDIDDIGWGSSDNGEDPDDNTLLLETIAADIFSTSPLRTLIEDIFDEMWEDYTSHWGWDMSRAHGNGDGTGQAQQGSSRVFLRKQTRRLGRVPSVDIHLDHENRAWYLWNSIEVKSIRLDHEESINDSLSRSEIKKSRPQKNIETYTRHIITKLCEQGLSAEAAEEMLRTRWSQSGKSNIAAGWRQWHEYCIDKNAFADIGDNPDSDRTIDVLSPTPCQLVDFLRVVRKGLRREGDKQGIGTSANWVRAIRSHISTTCTMWMSFAVGAHPLVTSYITSIQNEDFFVLKKKGYRYDDTWDTEPFYAEIRSRELHKQAKPINVRQAHMEETIAKIRDGALGVGRLALACRSADLTCIFRGIRSEHDTLRFYFQDEVTCPITRSRTGVKSIGGEPETPANFEGVGPYRVTGVSVRYFGPKQRHSMEVRSHGYTDWITVDAIPENPGICFASLLYWYVRASETMPKGVRDDHLFCSQKALQTNGSRYHGLVSASLAGIMKRLMTAAKIPAEFLPHSARAAGMAQGKTQGMTDDEVCTRSNVSRPTYTKYYQRQIRTKAYRPPAGIT